MRLNALAALLLVAACGPGKMPYPTLADYGLFKDTVKQIPADGVMPYDVNAVLWADGAVKYRFLEVPKGKHAIYDPTKQWTWPDGTILIKTFAYLKDDRDPAKGRRLLETRLIIKEDGKWTGNTYVWNDAQTQAVHEIAGDLLPSTWIDAEGKTQHLDYRVPDNNDCTKCHSTDHVFHPLGPRTRELNRDHDYGRGPVNQIDHMVELGTLVGSIPAADQRETLAPPYDTSYPLDARARGYLDANCAHCHSDGGAAESSGLDLGLETPFGPKTGVCKTPTSAGRGTGGFEFTLVPGDPDHSVMVYRMSSTDPEVKMPEMPTQTVDTKGVALIRAWIAAMPPVDCNTTPP